MTKKHLIKVAKLEIDKWKYMPKGIVIAILWAYIEHVTNGEPIEETFFKSAPVQPEYEI